MESLCPGSGLGLTSHILARSRQGGVGDMGGGLRKPPSPALQLPALTTPRCETKCRNGTYGDNCAFVCSDCVNGECHFETGRCLCRAGSHGT